MRRALALLLLLLLGCGDELSFGRLRASDASTARCEAHGPLVPGASCFAQALCSCGDYVSAGPTEATGALAIGGLLSAGDLVIDGQLTLAGTQGAALTGDLRAGSLQDRGPLQGNHTVTVEGDARVAGNVRLRSLRVGGAFTLADGAALELAEGDTPSTRRAPVEVASPCDCTQSFDLGARIDAARASNDNASIELEPELGLRTFDSARTLELPCGSYFVGQIYAASPIELRVRGRVALYVDRRVVTESTGSLTITLDPSAELDLFIRGGVTGAGPIAITGGATRLYVGGEDSFFFGAPATIEGSIHAPSSELVTQQTFTLTGSALVQRVVAEQRLTLRHASCD